MCILIQQPKGHTFSKVELHDFASHNPHGFGFMLAKKGELLFHKMTGTAEEMARDYYAHVAGKASILHFRYATHGPESAENSHPFDVVPGVMLAHNGILGSGNPCDDTKTDTEHLIEYFIRPMAEKNVDMLFDADYIKMLGGLIGNSNKLAIAAWDGRVAIVNQSAGVTHKGAWYSNTYAWTAPVPKSSTSVYGGYGMRPSSSAPKSVYGMGKEADPFDWGQDADDDNNDVPSEIPGEIEAYLNSATEAYWSSPAGTSMVGSLARWAADFPARAAILLESYYSTDREDIDAIVEDSDECAVWLEEIILDEIGTGSDK